MSSETHKLRNRTLVLLCGLLVYVGTHFMLSRASLSLVATEWGVSDRFLYLPVSPTFAADNEVPLFYVHHALGVFFYPAWKIDHVFGGPSPIESLPMIHGFEGA